MQPSTDEKRAIERSISTNARLVRRLAVLARFGLVRLFVARRTPGPFDWIREPGLPPDVQATKLALAIRPACLDAAADELAGLLEPIGPAPPPGRLGETPLVVLTATRDRTAIDLERQRELVRLSRNARQVLAEGSGHVIQVERPGLVVDAIRQVVESVRGGGPLR